MQPPRGVSQALGATVEATKHADDADGSCDLQSRIRKVLIAALHSLDLTDAVTYAAVEAAVIYIRLLGEKLEAGSEAAGTRKDWQKLRSLTLVQRSAHVLPCGRRLVNGGERASSVEGVYHPSKKVKTLGMVSRSTHTVQLKCSQCPQIISSNWFWTHPGTGERKVLVPASGHAVCKRRVGRRCAWRPLDGTGSLPDNFLSLDFCHHKRQRTKCKECGGSEICTHGRVRYQCRECKPAHKLQVAAGTLMRNERRSSNCLPVVCLSIP